MLRELHCLKQDKQRLKDQLVAEKDSSKQLEKLLHSEVGHRNRRIRRLQRDVVELRLGQANDKSNAGTSLSSSNGTYTSSIRNRYKNAHLRGASSAAGEDYTLLESRVEEMRCQILKNDRIDRESMTTNGLEQNNFTNPSQIKSNDDNALLTSQEFKTQLRLMNALSRENAKCREALSSIRRELNHEATYEQKYRSTKNELKRLQAHVATLEMENTRMKRKVKEQSAELVRAKTLIQNVLQQRTEIEEFLLDSLMLVKETVALDQSEEWKRTELSRSSPTCNAYASFVADIISEESPQSSNRQWLSFEDRGKLLNIIYNNLNKQSMGQRGRHC